MTLNLLDNRISDAGPFGNRKNVMSTKVIKAAEADKKVEELTKNEPGKTRSAKEVRAKLYGSKE